MRWNRPDWLGEAPAPGEAPPSNAAPSRYADDAPGSPAYRPQERDPQRQDTDYRATSARAALWASRTPSYQPDQPPEFAEPDSAEDHPYLVGYDTQHSPAPLAHVQASMTGTHTESYAPGVTSEVERLRRDEQVHGRTAGPAPYFWEMVQRPKQATVLDVSGFWLIAFLLIITVSLTVAYAGVSVYGASRFIYAQPTLPKGTPGDSGLAYKDVVFPSRTDHLMLHGWFIPGVVSPGHLTTRETIIMVHGADTNRADPGVGLLDLSDALAKHGLAVLTFDLRGSGYSPTAPTSYGYFEQRDVLGAVDYLQRGAMPYPALGRPRAIGGWGVSMGAATLLMAAAQDSSLRAIVSDSAYADVMPILQRDIPARTQLSSAFTPGVLEAAKALSGIDFSAVQPEAVVARIAPRPILFIHGAADTYVTPDNMNELAHAAQAASGAHTQTWLVPKAADGQAFHVAGQAYITRVVAFFAANLLPAA